MQFDIDPKFEAVRLVKELVKRESSFTTDIVKMYTIAKPILGNEIPKIFGNYTMHDIDHSIRIMEYMFDLMNNISDYSELEITILIYAAMLHDVGMAASETEIQNIKAEKYSTTDLKFYALLELKSGNENFAIQEFIRLTHAKRSRNKIETEWKNNFEIPNQPHFNFSKHIGLICQSHNEDAVWIEKNLDSYAVYGDFSFNPRYCSYLLRLGDLLDIDNKRTPLSLFRIINPTGQSNKEWKQHFIIKNYRKIEREANTGKGKIVVFGESSDPAIHRKFINYIQGINAELKNDISKAESFGPVYCINFLNNVELNIKTIGYTFSEDKLHIDFKAITTLLMGENIYGCKDLGLRELIQNSVDACIVRREISNSEMQFGDEEFKPIVKIIIDKKRSAVIIKDNGAGMNYEILKKYFLNIGVSYYNSDSYLLKGLNYQPIGNFGIGFLACFMLSNEVQVITRHHSSETKYKLEIEKASEYITLIEEEDLSFFGTEVILNYDQFMVEFKEGVSSVINFIKRNFLTDEIPIEVIDKDVKAITQVKNSIYKDGQVTSNSIEINFSNYLKSIEGFAHVRLSNHFINKVSDLSNLKGIPIFYDGSELKEINEDEFDIRELIVNNQISCLQIPIIDFSNEDEFDKIQEVLDDIDATIERLQNDLDWITIYSEPLIAEKYFKTQSISRNEFILPNVTLESLKKYGHVLGNKTVSYLKREYIFPDGDNNCNIPIFKSNQYRFSSFFKDHLFIRNVAVSNHSFLFDERADFFSIEDLKINAKSKMIFTDIVLS